MNRLITSLFDTPTVAAAPARRFVPATDLVESETHYILRADLPGVSEDEVTIELDGNILSISGERRSSSEQQQGGWYRYERSSGSFRRSVRLPEGVDADAIEASFERGVLEVSVAKPVAAKPQRITISTTRSSDQPAVIEASESEGAPAADSEPATAEPVTA